MMFTIYLSLRCIFGIKSGGVERRGDKSVELGMASLAWCESVIGLRGNEKVEGINYEEAPRRGIIKIPKRNGKDLDAFTFSKSKLPLGSSHSVRIEGQDIAGKTFDITFPINVPEEKCIPEFPTIALPAIIILGLLFLFSRRKRKE